jgi:hypothetical protein
MVHGTQSIKGRKIENVRKVFRKTLLQTKEGSVAEQ